MPLTDLGQTYWQEMNVFLNSKHCERTHYPIFIALRSPEKRRLSKTCFRGAGLARAGNFRLWNSPEDFFKDPSMLSNFMKHVHTSIEADTAHSRACIDTGMTVGWSSTDTIEGYHENDLEEFKPNHKSRALRVKTDNPWHDAPTTTFVTIVYTIQKEQDKTVVVIHTMYPGKDINGLSGDVTAREGCVFFDWNHMGTPV